MTVAVVVATGQVEDLPPRLLDQLAPLNVSDAYVIARPESAPGLRKGELGAEVLESEDVPGDLLAIARLARTAAEPLLILPGGTVANAELLHRLVGPRHDLAAAVIGPIPDGGPGDHGVRVSGGRIVSAGSGFHQVTDPNGVFCGPLRVSPAKRQTLTQVAERLAGLLVETPGGMPVMDTSTLLLVGLVREGVTVSPESAGRLVCVQARTAQQAAAAKTAVEAVDEDRVRLDAAVKSNDGFFTTYAVSTYSRFIARWAARRGLTPDMVTSISMGIAVLAAIWFAAGTRTGMIVGAVLYYFAFVFDCVDGQLARYTRQFSVFGAWLDATFDRAKEYVVFAGLALGSTIAAPGSSVNGGDVWGLAVAAMALQTCRHMVDFSYGASNRDHRKVPEPLPTVPLTVPEDGAEPAAAPKHARAQESLVVRLSNRTQKGVLRWAKKIIVLPIGERFALVSITAALFNARVTFIALLAWGLLAAVYTLTGRLMRSLST